MYMPAFSIIDPRLKVFKDAVLPQVFGPEISITFYHIYSLCHQIIIQISMSYSQNAKNWILKNLI